MLQRYRAGIVPERVGTQSELGRRFVSLPAVVRERILDLRFREALEGIWELVTALNRTIDERKPWELHKTGRTEELDALLYDLCEGLRWLAIMLQPFMPERMKEMWQQLGAPGLIDEDWSASLKAWGGLVPATQTALAAPLFPKLEEPLPA
jgi:methionyl-tRNA synthetase